jgi:5-methylcytosine-specific restriction endonuclease McrA
MTKHALLLNRLMALPSPTKHNKQNKLFNHAAMNGYRCVSCSVVNPFLTVDHIKPKSSGGTHNTDNLQLLRYIVKDGNYYCSNCGLRNQLKILKKKRH